jgi:hypothetical protein
MKNCAPSWLYLQDYTGMQVQQNINNIKWSLSLPEKGLSYHMLLLLCLLGSNQNVHSKPEKLKLWKDTIDM